MLVGDGNDMVLPLGDSTSGKYMVSFQLFIETGSGAYYNLQHITLSEWAMEVYLNNGGAAHIDVEGATHAFTFTHDTWMKVENYIDMDADSAYLFIDGQKIHSWKFSATATASSGTKKLGAINFYSGAESGIKEYYIDDLKFSTMHSVTLNLDATVASIDPITQSVYVSGATADDMDGIGMYAPWPVPGDTEGIMMTAAEDIYTTTIMYVVPGDYKYKYHITDGTTTSNFPGTPLDFTVVDADISISDTWVGLNDAKQLNFNLYPNPTNGYTKVSVNGVGEIIVTNMIGQTIMTAPINSNYNLDLSNQISGLYFVTAKTNNGIATLRLIIE